MIELSELDSSTSEAIIVFSKNTSNNPGSQKERSNLGASEAKGAIIRDTVALVLGHDQFNLDQLKHNLLKLRTYSNLPLGWNIGTARPTGTNVIQRVADILPDMIYQPEMFPTGRNSVQFEYEKDNGEYLEIEIFNDHYEILVGNENDEREYTTLHRAVVVSQIYDFFNWLHV